jgi:hypothetical protein
LGAVLRGAVAGAVGTATMTAAQAVEMKATGREPSTTPAEVAKRLIEGVLQREVSESETGTLNNVMHWLYGTSWGVAYGIVEGSRSRPPSLRSGLVFGSVVWAASLIELPALGVAPPVWEYPPRELVSDVALHLAYGAGAAAAFAPLRR